MRTLIVIILSSLLWGCAGTPFNWSEARQIKTGMTEQEVTQLMGSPFLVKSQAGGITWVWSYANSFSGVKTVSVVFRDGKVIEPPPIPTSFK